MARIDSLPPEQRPQARIRALARWLELQTRDLRGRADVDPADDYFPLTLEDIEAVWVKALERAQRVREANNQS